MTPAPMTSAPMTPAPRTRWIAILIAGLLLGVLAFFSAWSMMPPSAKPANAPADQFSAGRAMHHVDVIGRHRHVTGSKAAAHVRQYLVDTLKGYGYSPEVHEGIGQTASLDRPSMALVRNVVTVIPGYDSTARLIMMAHYDSVQVSYGANDDGSGVSTLLETARALATGPQLRNDVVLLLTDAEEACLCGAESFVHSDPLGADGGVVLNFESRGSTGPPIMFETTAGNEDLVRRYADAVPHPVSTSMAVEVYRILPNDTDFTPFIESGRFTGLNSAYIDGSATYHTPQDRPTYVDRGTLQADGDNALALARDLGNADLADLAAPAGHDATYFPVLGTLVIYSGVWVWPLAILAALAVAALAWAVRRRFAVSAKRLAGAFGLMLVPLAGAAVVAQLFWMMLVAIRPAYGAMLDPWDPGWFRAAVCALVAFVVVGWYALWRKRFTPWGLALGGLGWLALLGVALAVATPGGAYLAALPTLVASVLGLVAIALRAWWMKLVAVTLAAAVGIVVLVPVVMLFFPALGLATGAGGALMAAMLGLVALPFIELLQPAVPTDRLAAVPAPPDAASPPAMTELPDGGRTGPDASLPSTGDPEGRTDPRPKRSSARPRLRAMTATGACLLLGIAFTAAGFATDHFDAQHPTRTQLMYALDNDSGTALWVSAESDPTGWVSQYVDEMRDISREFPFLDGSYLVGQAPRAELAAPRLTVDSDSVDGAQRRLTLTIHPRRDVRLVTLTAPNLTVDFATVTADGISRALQLDGHGLALLFQGPPADGVTVHLVIDGTEPATFQVAGGSDGLAGLPGFTPRPPDVGIQGTHTSELVLVTHTVTV